MGKVGKAVGGAVTGGATGFVLSGGNPLGAAAGAAIGGYGGYTSAQSESARNKAMAEAMSMGGMPVMPQFESPLKYNKSTKQYYLPEEYKIQDKLNTQALQQLRSEALRNPTQASAMAQLQYQKQALEEQQARQAALGQAMQGIGAGQMQLASRGGLRSGAAERLAQMGATNLMKSQQAVGAEGRLARLNVALEDEKNRLAALSAMPGMEAQAAQAQEQIQQLNIAQLAEQHKLQEEKKLAAYQEQMKGWAAGKQAQGIAASVPSKGLLGSILG